MADDTLPPHVQQTLQKMIKAHPPSAAALQAMAEDTDGPALIAVSRERLKRGIRRPRALFRG